MNAHRLSACQSRNWNLNKSRRSPHTSGSSAHCPHPSLIKQRRESPLEPAASFLRADHSLTYQDCLVHTCVVMRRTTFARKMIVLSFVSEEGTKIGSLRDVLSPNMVLRTFVFGVFTKLLLRVLSGSKFCVLWP